MRTMWMLMFLAACGAGVSHDPGADAQAASCTPGGSGTLHGTSKGQTIGPIASAYLVQAGGMYVIALDDDAQGACSQPPPVGYHMNLIFCAMPVARMYDAVAEKGFSCPTNVVYANLRDDVANMDFADGLGGTIDVTSVAGGCITGTYDLRFDDGGASGSPGDELTGSFDAVVCP